MDLFRLLELRLGRWLAYADSCLSAEIEHPRCQGFWTLVAGLFIVICLVLVAGVTAKLLQERRQRRAVNGKYTRLE